VTTWQWILAGFGVWLVVALAFGFVLGRVLRRRRVLDTDVLQPPRPAPPGEVSAPPDDAADDEVEELAEHRSRRES
jgi:hypothetical protein